MSTTNVNHPAKRYQHPLIREIRRELESRRGSGEWGKVARAAGIKVRSIHAIAQGSMREMTATRELRLAEALGIKVHWLMPAPAPKTDAEVRPRRG